MQLLFQSKTNRIGVHAPYEKNYTCRKKGNVDIENFNALTKRNWGLASNSSSSQLKHVGLSFSLAFSNRVIFDLQLIIGLALPCFIPSLSNAPELISRMGAVVRCFFKFERTTLYILQVSNARVMTLFIHFK